MLVPLYQTTRRHTPFNRNLSNHLHENYISLVNIVYLNDVYIFRYGKSHILEHLHI
jgi:hypothetical protein